jgi:SAM-dependent methyltransferase
MPEGPQTWHYGLVAKWWAEFNEGGPEIDYFRTFIERDGQPALDVACGTGRLLLPYVRAGLDVDGCDVSADMIALCREQAEREGLSPTLFVQAMHELDPPRTYRTVFVCGGFGLGSTREQDLEALVRMHECLEPGGTLVLDNEVPYANPRQWSHWPKGEQRGELPRPWGEPVEPRRGSDGNDYGLNSRLLSLDPLEQQAVLEMRAHMWRDGELLAEEEHRITINLYFRNELLLMLERAGFVDVVVHGDHKEQEATPDHDFLVFVAKKPGLQQRLGR